MICQRVSAANVAPGAVESCDVVYISWPDSGGLEITPTALASGPLATIASMDKLDLSALRIPAALRDRAREILAITDQACSEHLDDDYAAVCRRLVGRLASVATGAR
jgi:hypothetical protein